jgi:hypothetical protein
MRDHDVSSLTVAELKRAKRELSASLALSLPGALSDVPTLAQLSAIDNELAERGTGLRLCSCGFASNGEARFEAHLTNNPGHNEQPQP